MFNTQEAFFQKWCLGVGTLRSPDNGSTVAGSGAFSFVAGWIVWSHVWTDVPQSDSVRCPRST